MRRAAIIAGVVLLAIIAYGQQAASQQQQGISASAAVGQVRSTLTRSVSVLDEVETAVEIGRAHV